MNPFQNVLLILTAAPVRGGYVEDPNKLMFGTDWPLTSIQGYLNAFKTAIPRQYWKQVFHDNAARVFKFKS